MTTRNELLKMVADNRDDIQSNLDNFWRHWAEDLVAGGVPGDEVARSMVTVAVVQCMAQIGATKTAFFLEKGIDLMKLAAEHGWEYPATEH